MGKKLLFDDDDSFITTMDRYVSALELPDVVVTSSYEEAQKVIAEEEVERIVTDMVLEDRKETGLDLLQYAKRIKPDAERVVLTGKDISRPDKIELKKINARTIHKSILSKQVVRALFGDEDVQFIDSPEVSKDVGELALQLEEMGELNNLLIEDLFEELIDIENQTERAFHLGNKSYSVAEIRDEVYRKTEVGRTIIRWHRNLSRRLRGR